ncbi:hypothetical protein [uncultured Adlercreutzia sp.]|uniref:hypothetical protein n=1 Tax=uncultured Adlercreutzia sp. TaxID=875803 RepID=UPI00258368B3|nr:hypothetical protein [uncultured Adlercreutzia sp.]
MAHVESHTLPQRFDIPRREMHYLREPHGFAEGTAWGNLGYQMAYSAKVLEERLAEEGRFFVLQLNVERGGGGGWKNPTSWRLYANGRKVASGSGDFARECFYESAERFMDECRAALDDSGIAPVDEHDYRLLKTAQRIASLEPFDDDNPVLGGREYRVF